VLSGWEGQQQQPLEGPPARTRHELVAAGLSEGLCLWLRRQRARGAAARGEELVLFLSAWSSQAPKRCAQGAHTLKTRALLLLLLTTTTCPSYAFASSV